MNGLRPAAQQRWRLLLAALLATILWLALTPAPPKQADLGWDKLNHASAFATLALVATRGFGRAAWWRIALALLAYGGLIEVLQSFTPTRQAEWADLLADAVGVAAGLVLSLAAGWLLARRWRPGDGQRTPTA
jgi:VanZ family protein